MKRVMTVLGGYAPWLTLLALVDGFAVLMVWLAAPESFRAITALVLLASGVLGVGLCSVLLWRERQRHRAFRAFLSHPDTEHEKNLCRWVTGAEKEQIRLLGDLLRRKADEYALLESTMEEYQSYVEAWAHEAKTPLSLLTFLLDNRRQELPDAFAYKLDYVQTRLQESMDQMLFYARLKSGKKDYLLEWVNVADAVQEVVEDYMPLLTEKRFRVECTMENARVFTDRRGLRFVLGQLVSNGIKYSKDQPCLSFHFTDGDREQVLTVTDNGIGVCECDVPFLFERGFTGDSGTCRGKATGMGLYLAAEVAKDLNFTMEPQTQWGRGFRMVIRFPKVTEKEKWV